MKFPRLIVCLLALSPIALQAAELPVLHLRTATSAPPVVAMLQDPATASAWYPSSPTWFGLGGKTGDKNHTEVLATYDNTALYIAFVNVDRSTVNYPKGTTTDITTVDSNAIWIQTPAGKSFYLLACIDTTYPPAPRQASGQFPAFDPKTDKLAGWSHAGWYAGNKTMQQSIRIPWSTLQTSAPVAGSRWRVNFVNYNQTSTSLTASTVKRQTWAPGTESQPAQWGYLAFDQAVFTPPSGISPEATLTLRPGMGYGGETTIRAGNGADQTNMQSNEAITQSNWNDWDPIDYTIKEFMQFDLSMIPRDRTIISATLRNNFRGHFESSPTDLYVHVLRLASSYDPKAVTMLTSPLPVENGYRRLVKAAEVGTWINFDVTDVVSRAFASGAQKAAFALAGSSGDIHNGKIWNVSFGRADWYDQSRPTLTITFGSPTKKYTSPVCVGSGNYTSVATTASKNKLTNGTFAYGTVEGSTDTTYWNATPAYAYVNGANVAFMQLVGDVNPNTGHKALRFMTPVNWKQITQWATGIVGGTTYVYSGWYKGSASGIKSDVRLNFYNAAGSSLGSGQAVYSGSGNWEKVKLVKAAPAGSVTARVDLVNWTSGAGAYMLYSDLQLEAGSTPTAYSETMGIYYPTYPRTDGAAALAAMSAPAFAASTLQTDCIAFAEKSGMGRSVKLDNMVVTGAFSGFFYVQDTIPDHRFCGIEVVGSESPAVGSLVDIVGTLGKDANGEPVMNAAVVTTIGTASLPDPLSWSDGGSLVGVLVDIHGRVISLDEYGMVIDDGSGALVTVIGPTGAAVLGADVDVIGICGLARVGTAPTRVIRTRSADDVTVISD